MEMTGSWVVMGSMAPLGLGPQAGGVRGEQQSSLRTVLTIAIYTVFFVLLGRLVSSLTAPYEAAGTPSAIKTDCSWVGLLFLPSAVR